MLSRVRSMGLNGIRGYEVSVECYNTNGLPGFEIVGLRTPPSKRHGSACAQR